jgi:hypothetical protein
MQEYERQILVTNDGPEFPATLKVIRLPTSWHAVIGQNPERYATFSFAQEGTALNAGFSRMGNYDFLRTVQFVAAAAAGIDFEFEEAV